MFSGSVNIIPVYYYDGDDDRVRHRKTYSPRPTQTHMSYDNYSVDRIFSLTDLLHFTGKPRFVFRVGKKNQI